MLFFLFLALQSTSFTLASESFDRFYEGKREAVRDVASELAKAMAPSARCQASESCNKGFCIPNGCGHDSFGGEYRCSDLILSEGQEPICPKTCSSGKRLLNLETASLSAPPKTMQYETKDGVQNFKLNDLNLLRDVCALKSIRRALQKAFEKHNLRSWLYIGTSSGLQMTYPGAARRRETPNLEQCGFVPMSRPWYIAASSGNKDVVFIFDTTSLTTSEKILSMSLISAIAALGRNDYVSVISMGKTVEVLGNSDKLERATSEVKEQLKQDVKRLKPSSGRPDTSALEEAFSILRRSKEQGSSSGCSKIIVLLIGNEPVCFEQCRLPPMTCTCTSDLVDSIIREQESLGENVSIVTFTEGNNNNAERVARSFVCESSAPGAWRRVSSSESPESSLSAYTDIASLTQKSKEYTSEITKDFSGLGDVFTIAQPVYEAESVRLVGVVGVDITIAQVSKAVGGREIAESAINTQIGTENRNCEARNPDSCEMQTLRAQYGGVCADILVRSDQTWKCFRAGESLYMRLETALTWSEARLQCRSFGSGSDLAIVDSRGKNEIVAGISSLDGSWIGLRATQGENVQWVNGSEFVARSLGFSITNGDIQAEIDELHQQELVDACVSVDRRGISENWNIVPCDAKRLATCEVKENSENASVLCPTGSIFDRRRTEYEPINNLGCDTSGFPSCPAEEDEALKTANPFCEEKSETPRSEFDRICCGGRSDSGPREECKDDGAPVAAIAGGVIGGLLAVAAVVLVVFLLFPRMKRCRASDSKASSASTPSARLNEITGTKIDIRPEDLHRLDMM